MAIGKVYKNIKYHSKSRFDHYLISRAEAELKKRVDLILKAAEKEAKDGMWQVKNVVVREVMRMKEIWEGWQREEGSQESDISRPKSPKKESLLGKREREEVVGFDGVKRVKE